MRTFANKEIAAAAAADFKEYLNDPGRKVAPRSTAADTPYQPCPTATPSTKKQRWAHCSACALLASSALLLLCSLVLPLLLCYSTALLLCSRLFSSAALLCCCCALLPICSPCLLCCARLSSSAVLLSCCCCCYCSPVHAVSLSLRSLIAGCPSLAALSDCWLSLSRCALCLIWWLGQVHSTPQGSEERQ
jgi:hypothetical protein